MEVCNIVIFNSSEKKHWCQYYGTWNKIPVYVSDDPDSRSALYKDGTCFIILGSSLLRNGSDIMILNRLWHEAAHLYFHDVWQPWSIHQEFRADLIASAATGREVSLRRLHDMKHLAVGSGAEKVIDRRIDNLSQTRSVYTKSFCLGILDNLRPVTIIN